MDQIIQGAQCGLDRRERVEAMHKVDVNPVCTEPLEASLHCPHDVAPRGSLGIHIIAHRKAELGGEH